MAICAIDMKKEKRLKNNIVVTTVMSNLGFEVFLKKSGIKMVRTQVGDRYVVEEKLRQGWNLGGEQAGNIVFRDAKKKAEHQLKGGRILVSPSGTEPKIRVMVEGSNMHKITAIAEGFAEVIKSKMA